MGVVEFTAARSESATFDEGPYIAAGYSYWKTRDFRMNLEHPPLSKWLIAAPLLAIQPDLPLEHTSWPRANLLDFSNVFLYENRIPADRMLLAARGVTILLTLALGLAVALWTRRLFGAGAALFAAFLFITDPNLTAHGRYATNDVAVALFFFLAVVAWARYLESTRIRHLALAGVVFALALLTKFSAILLVPVFVALYALRTPRLSLDRFFASWLVLTLITVGLILPAYCFEMRPCVRTAATLNPNACTLDEASDPRTPAGHFLHTATRALHLPDHPFLIGFFMQYVHNESGHMAYLLGKTSQLGWWYYFPVVFAVKTPTAVLALLFAGVFVVFRRRLQRVAFDWWVILLPPALYFTVAMTGHIDIGVRYLLPAYPFLFVALAGLVKQGFGKARLYVVALAAVVQIAECAAIYPYHLAFFNWPSGGPARGAHYLLDSNLDWGQDLKRLKRYWDAQGRPPLCLAYFGTAPPAYYGIESINLPPDPKPDLNCLAAISVNLVHGLYLPPGSFEWIAKHRPTGNIGHSIYLYDLRKPTRIGRAAVDRPAPGH